jgi:hypothetical protein
MVKANFLEQFLLKKNWSHLEDLKKNKNLSRFFEDLGRFFIFGNHHILANISMGLPTCIVPYSLGSFKKLLSNNYFIFKVHFDKKNRKF